MATLSIEDKKYDLAMNILQRLERWCTREDLLSHRQRMVGRAITLGEQIIIPIPTHTQCNERILSDN